MSHMAGHGFNSRHLPSHVNKCGPHGAEKKAIQEAEKEPALS